MKASLKSIASFCKDGDWIELKDQSVQGIRLIQTGNVGCGSFLNKQDRAKYITDDTFHSLKCTEIFPGDILISRLPDPVGRACLVPNRSEKMITAVDCTIVRLDPCKCINQYFIFYTDSESYKAQVKSFLAGSTRVRISRKNLEQIMIPLCSIQEQQFIVNCLKNVKRSIALKQQQLVRLDQLAKSRFIEMFGDPISTPYKLTHPMPEVCDIIDGDRGNNYPTQEDFTDSGHCLFLNAKNVTSSGFKFESCVFISEEKDSSLRKGKLKRGDVVLTTRGTLGNIAFYDESVPFEHVRINSGMVILRMNHSIISEVFFIEQFKLLLAAIKQKIASGSAQPQLPINTMNQIRLIVPPLALQNEFAAFIEQLDKSKVTIQKSLDKLNLLYKALLQEYFG